MCRCSLSGYLPYALTECPDWFGISGKYLSNFGRNFRIDMSP